VLKRRCGVSESTVGDACKSSTEDVLLRAKPAVNYHDVVFYYPADQTADDDDSRRGPAHVVSAGRVTAATAAASCSSDDWLPVKEAVSMQMGVGNDMPLIAGSPASRRRPSMLRKIRAFFARSSNSNSSSCSNSSSSSSSSSCSSSSSSTSREDDTTRAGRHLPATDASMMTPAGPSGTKGRQSRRLLTVSGWKTPEPLARLAATCRRRLIF